MKNYTLKFVFLKTPQLRHNFRSNINQNVFPVINHEIYYAVIEEANYKFFGKSYSGDVSIKNFKIAVEESYISIISDT